MFLFQYPSLYNVKFFNAIKIKSSGNETLLKLEDTRNSKPSEIKMNFNSLNLHFQKCHESLNFHEVQGLSLLLHLTDFEQSFNH